ncbi:MAG: ABC transporter ATP-binding protein [Desulfonauticus sp.]|nr:ABC transporter ATP-binding protein [Desulfonauticus sp.]
MEILKRLRYLLTRRDKIYLLVLLFFSIVIAIIETAGISVIMPFIRVATDFNQVFVNKYIKQVYYLFHFSNPQNFVIAFGLVLIVFYIFRSAINLFYFYLLSRFAFSRYHLIAYRLFENYIKFPYKDFVTKNSATLTKNIVNEANNLTLFISALLFLLSEIAIVIILYSMMLYINYKITFLMTAFLIVNGIILIKIVTKKIKTEGVKRSKFQNDFYKVINSTFGNFKFIKLIGNEQEILNKFSQASFSFAKTNIINQTLSHFPRLFLEAIGFSLVIFIVVYLVWKYNTDIGVALGMITMFVLALYRLMPSVNRIFNSINQLAFYKKSFDIVHNDLMYEVEDLGDEKIDFNKKIEVQNLTFGYEEGKNILEDVNLIIKRGEKVAFIGESGAGKSTLIDLIIGIYKPIKGNIFIDDTKLSENNVKSWRKKIGFIPQTIYLFDGTVGENVAFGREFDEQKIIEALQKARIWDFFKKKQGIYTRVGEGGIMLSGGQKQRVGIARAIYSNPEVLVLDEATSALDYETEKEIMQEIFDLSKNKTLLIIAHRHSTIKNCDKIYEVKNKSVKWS